MLDSFHKVDNFREIEVQRNKVSTESWAIILLEHAWYRITPNHSKYILNQVKSEQSNIHCDFSYTHGAMVQSI